MHTPQAIAGVLALAVTIGPAAAAAENGSAGGRVYKLHAQNGSHEYGTVALKPGAGSTNVEIHLVNAPAGVMQPAHVHLGTCAKLDPAPKYPLPAVLDGTADGTVPVALSDLLATPMAVNIHRSGDDAKTYVACADLKP
ncbi:MAG: hypothetical protein NVSMB19_16310 [Vulcanimicrobiaceae bacterium]